MSSQYSVLVVGQLRGNYEITFWDLASNLPINHVYPIHFAPSGIEVWPPFPGQILDKIPYLAGSERVSRLDMVSQVRTINASGATTAIKTIVPGGEYNDTLTYGAYSTTNPTSIELGDYERNDDPSVLVVRKYGYFSTFAARPTGLGTGDANKLYLFTRTGTIHRWTGTAWEICNTSTIDIQDYGAISGAYSAPLATANAAAIQNALNACTGNQTILISNGSYPCNELAIPITNRISISGGGTIVFGAGVGFHRTVRVDDATVGNPFKNGLYISNIRIVSTDCLAIWEDQLYASNGNQGIEVDHCEFILTNSIGIQIAGAYFNKISDNIFYNDAGSTSIRCKAGTGFTTTAQVSTVSNNTFKFGTAINTSRVGGTTSAWEGWYFTGNHYFASKVVLHYGNSIRFTCDEFISAHVELDGMFNSAFSNCYFDRNSFDGGAEILGIYCVSRDSSNIRFNGCQFNAQGTAGNMIVLNSPIGGTYQVTNVSFTGNDHIAGIAPASSAANQANAIVVIGRVNAMMVVGDKFMSLYTCIDLRAGEMLRSVVSAIDARDCLFFGKGFTAANTAQSQVGCMFKVLSLEAVIPTYLASGSVEEIFSYTIDNREMIMTPAITLSAQTTTNANLAAFVDAPSNGTVNFKVIKQIAAPGGQLARVSATVTLDGTTITAR
jgi:hypothetical protein